MLVLDCENGQRHTRRRIRPLVTQARRSAARSDEKNLWIECRPAGMDLALDRDVSWLLRQVAAVSPDIVMLGPLYRLAPRALNSDDEAAPIIAVLNMIRARDCCVLLEAHSGHATGHGGRRDPRPRGSSAFLGWPEFGYGLRWSEENAKDGGRSIVSRGEVTGTSGVAGAPRRRRCLAVVGSRCKSWRLRPYQGYRLRDAA